MPNYQLSEEAEFDLEGIYEYGLLNYGLKQADIYYDGLFERFEQIAKTPLRYRSASEIR